MEKFEVTYQQITTYKVVVEAEDSSAAEDMVRNGEYADATEVDSSEEMVSEIVSLDNPEDDFEIIECSECGEEKAVELGTWALDKGMCEPCYCIYQGG